MAEKDGQRKRVHVRLQDGLLAGVQCRGALTLLDKKEFDELESWTLWNEYYAQYMKYNLSRKISH